MLPIQYAYFFGASLFIIPWTFVFIKRSDLRMLLIQVGVLLAGIGLICEYFWWTKDWWKPETLTGTVIGIEDLILGFTNGGLAASLYLVLFRKKFIPKKAKLSGKPFLLFLIIISNLMLFAILFSFKINSFISTLITMFSVCVMLLINQRRLIIPALINGLLMVALVIPIYLAVIYLTPHVVEKTWMIPNLLGIYFLGVPLEDYIFYFLSGVYCLGIYPFYKGLELKDV